MSRIIHRVKYDGPGVPKGKWDALDAGIVATLLSTVLGPFCERIEVAGSLRREKQIVGDVELLYIPRFETRQSLFDFTLEEKVNLANECIDAMLRQGELAKRPNIKGHFTYGAQNKLMVHAETGIPVDLFSTTEANWWVSLVIRTGSKETNLKLTTGAQKRGRTLHTYGSGVEKKATGEMMVCGSEEDVFAACGIPFLLPHNR